MDASGYKQKIFDERLLQVCLGVIELAEFTHADPAILRKALLDALGSSTSLEQLTEYWSKLSLALSAVKNSSPESSTEFDLNLMLNAAHSIGQGSANTVSDFFTTITKLANTKRFAEWSDFFSTSLVTVEDEAITTDFFTTARHLADNDHFTQWIDFFKMVKRLKESSSPTEAEVFTAVRHAIQYLNTNESAKGLFRVLAEAPQYSEAFAYGQLDSKKWLIEEAQKVWGNDWGTVFVLAGWIGVLPRMIFDQNISMTKIRSFDLDGPANQASEFLNQTEVQQDWLFKSSKQDITKMQYPTNYNVLRKDGSECELTDMPSVVINTSCEHIQDIASWWSQIPQGTRVILQSNDGFQITEHVACFKSLKEFAQAMSLSRTDYVGEKALPEFNRFMLIGTK